MSRLMMPVPEYGSSPGARRGNMAVGDYENLSGPLTFTRVPGVCAHLRFKFNGMTGLAFQLALNTSETGYEGGQTVISPLMICWG